MKILILGGGGREHSFAWKLAQSPHCSKLYIAPGNAGTLNCGINVSIAPTNFKNIGAFALQHDIEMILVGPEEPLVRGIYDYFKQTPELADILMIGPSKEGARLEGSKAFAKKFMAECGIPTAQYAEFTQEKLEEGIQYIEDQQTPIVLKADGLAAGKGVLICEDRASAKITFREMLAGKFGAASSRVVIEQFLKGMEFSVFVLTDGKSYQVWPIAKDYKRIGEGDKGLNTGGMGAVSPVPFVDSSLWEKVEHRIIQPTIQGIIRRKIEYQGFIFFGLIAVDGDPYVIEYNCRMGDPETQVVLPRIKNDLVELLYAATNGQLEKVQLEIDERAATAVVLVSGGYPEAYEKGKVISGLDEIEGSILFHAGTRKENNLVLTNGGRVLAVSSFGKDFREALDISNKNAQIIRFADKYYRRDIGFDL